MSEIQKHIFIADAQKTVARERGAMGTATRARTGSLLRFVWHCVICKFRGLICLWNKVTTNPRLQYIL